MRLIDPLQGIKMAQMNLVVHITFFFMIIIVTWDQHDEELRGIKRALRALMYTHILQAVIQLAGLFMKHSAKNQEWTTMSQWLVTLSIPFCVLFPEIYALYKFREAKIPFIGQHTN